MSNKEIEIYENYYGNSFENNQTEVHDDNQYSYQSSSDSTVAVSQNGINVFDEIYSLKKSRPSGEPLIIPSGNQYVPGRRSEKNSTTMKEALPTASSSSEKENVNVFDTQDISRNESHICDSCKRVDGTMDAVSFCLTCNEYLCCDCFRAHRKAKPTMKHDVVEGDDMPHGHCDFLNYKCKKHEEEDVNYHCLTHDELFCSICLESNEHNACRCRNLDESKVTPDDLQKPINLIKQLKTKLDDQENRLTTRNVQKVDKEKQHLKRIRSQLSAFSDILDRNRTSDESGDDMKRSEMRNLQSEIQTELPNWISQLNMLKTGRRSRQITLFSKHLQQKIEEYEDAVRKIGLDSSTFSHNHGEKFLGCVMESLDNYVDVLENRIQQFQKAGPPPVPSRTTESSKIIEEFAISRDCISVHHKTTQTFPEIWLGKMYYLLDILIEKHPKECMTKEAILNQVIVMKNLKHDNIIRLLAVCIKTSPYDIFIITEHLPHGTLLMYLKFDIGRYIKFKEQLYISGQISDGMSYLSSMSIIHRALKASNIYVGRDNKVKIGGFPFAYKIQKDSENPYENTSDFWLQSGKKPQYSEKWTAPESIQNQKWSLKSDVWSFGIVLYEIITRGNEPYEGIPETLVLQEKINEGYRIPEPPECHPAFYELMRCCWNKTPERRPTFDYLQDALNNFDVYAEAQYDEEK